MIANRQGIQVVWRITLVIMLSVALSGCIDRQVFLKKTAPDGTTQIAHCDGKGFGLIPMVMEEQNLNDCRAYYRQNGYIEQ
jgi:hypothetical protein